MNLCFLALDLPVVRGAANEIAVVHGTARVDFATMLERSAALGGAMCGLGIAPGHGVGALLEDPLDGLLLLLACARIGAAYVELPPAAAPEAVDAHQPRLVALNRPVAFGRHTPAVCLVRGFPPADERRDLDWDLALRAGRTDPAPSVELPPAATAFVVDGTAVSVGDALGHDSWPGRRLASLAAGDPVEL